MLRWLGAAKRKQNQLQQRNQTNSELSERTDDLSEANPMNENNSEQIVQSTTSEENHCSSLNLQVEAAITADAEVAASECVEHPAPENAEHLVPECSESLPHSTATTAKSPRKTIRRNGRRYVCCESCFHFSNVFKLHSNSTKLPAIATKDGTIFREKIVKTHLNSKDHRGSQGTANCGSSKTSSSYTNEKNVRDGTITIS